MSAPDTKVAWEPCASCGEFWGNIHQMHAHECECPPIEEWETDPYCDPISQVPDKGAAP